VNPFRSLSSLLFAALVAAALLLPAGAMAHGGFKRGESLVAPSASHGSTSLSAARKVAAPGPASIPGTPAGPAAAGTSSSALLFDGTSLGDFGIEAAPHAVTEVADPDGSGETVFKMSVRNSDVYPLTPTDNPRAQALSPALIEPGDEFWLSTKFLIPEGFPFVNGWMSLVSIYGPPFEGSSPWQISVNEDEFRWMREDGRSIPWHVPLVEGAWQTVTLHERFGTNGFVEMWWDGERITFYQPGDANPDHEPETAHLEIPTMDSSNDAGPNSAKIMQYRMKDMFSTASVYFGALKLGSTRASVEG
jgi:Polysaccharide lyase